MPSQADIGERWTYHNKYVEQSTEPRARLFSERNQSVASGCGDVADSLRCHGDPSLESQAPARLKGKPRLTGMLARGTKERVATDNHGRGRERYMLLQGSYQAEMASIWCRSPRGSSRQHADRPLIQEHLHSTEMLPDCVSNYGIWVGIWEISDVSFTDPSASEFATSRGRRLRQSLRPPIHHLRMGDHVREQSFPGTRLRSGQLDGSKSSSRSKGNLHITRGFASSSACVI